ncbi:universal stress protein [bacterium]|nr:universal stress protein [bacterium]MBU1636255.1 universal stress protein [bacterium]MBU1920406.1 universal stress protein [bacterium]
MSKRIIVGLDGSLFAEAAMDAAIDRASRCDGTIVGVAVIDQPGIEHSEAGAGAGAAYFARDIIDKKMSEALAKTRDLLIHFADRCRTAEVKYELAREEGVPFDALVEYGRASDMMIVGQHTHFQYDTDARPGGTVKRLMNHPVVPVLAVPEKWIAPQHVIIAYDSSIHTTRAMRAFVHQQNIVPFAEDVTLLYVNDEDVDAVIRHELDLAEKYLRAHGLKVSRMSRKGKVGRLLVEAAQEFNPCMIVMGSSRQSWLTELLSGSVEEQLIKHSIPVFVFE